jgi:hypothetical protein
MPRAYSDYDVTLKFRIATDDPQGLDCPALTKMLSDRLNGWSDGRRAFDVEMVTYGLIDLLRQSVRDTIELEMRGLYGNQIINHGNGSRSSRAHLETDKKFAEAKLPWLCWEPTVEIVRRDDR